MIAVAPATREQCMHKVIAMPPKPVMLPLLQRHCAHLIDMIYPHRISCRWLQGAGVVIRPAIFFAIWNTLALRQAAFKSLYAAGLMAAYWTSALGLFASLLLSLPAAALGVLTFMLVVALPLSTTMPAFDWSSSTGGSYLSGMQPHPFTGQDLVSRLRHLFHGHAASCL